MKGDLVPGLNLDLFSSLSEREKNLQIESQNYFFINTIHSSPRRLVEEKKSTSYNHKTTIWVSHEYYLNPEFHKILSRAF